MPQTVVPKQCSAITKKGTRCLNPAILGDLHCRIHSKPSPKDPGGSGNLAKVGLQAFFEALLKVGIQTAIQILHKFFSVTYVNVFGLTKIDADELDNELVIIGLGEWFQRLSPEQQQRAVEVLQARANERTMSAGAS